MGTFLAVRNVKKRTKKKKKSAHSAFTLRVQRAQITIHCLTIKMHDTDIPIGMIILSHVGGDPIMYVCIEVALRGDAPGMRRFNWA